jgi:hypothetical protein
MLLEQPDLTSAAPGAGDLAGRAGSVEAVVVDRASVARDDSPVRVVLGLLRRQVEYRTNLHAAFTPTGQGAVMSLPDRSPARWPRHLAVAAFVLLLAYIALATPDHPSAPDETGADSSLMLVVVIMGG